jgi:hypothetical protein
MLEHAHLYYDHALALPLPYALLPGVISTLGVSPAESCCLIQGWLAWTLLLLLLAM